MRIKSKPQDFRVFELLHDGYVGEKGRFRIYRVTKKKLTSLEAASELALATGVLTSEIGMAGMKDRQGVTTQFMSVRGGRPVRFQTPSLKVETVGSAMHSLSSRDSMGNGFEIALRGVDPGEHEEIEREAVSVREHGVPNYFGEQRFGNLRHGQGWVAKELALGRPESALKNLLAAPSENDNPHMRSFKRGLQSAWGDWKRCRDVAGAYGAHHSIFEHLAKEPVDFAGAFRYVKTEVRLIHLYAFQSHIWNRAVARCISETSRPADKVIVPSLEGPLAFSRAQLAIPDAWNGNFRMPGEGLEDVEHDDQRRWLTAALAAEGMDPADFRVHGVDGFGMKGEDRALVVHPRRLEIFPDRRSEGVLHVSFELPRGSYATLVLARLAPTREAETPDDAARRLRREQEQAEGAGREDAPRFDDRRDDRARSYGERSYGERADGGRQDGGRYPAQRDDRPNDASRRFDAPRYEGHRGAWRADSAPRRDAPRFEGGRPEERRYDGPRYEGQRQEEPRHEGQRFEGRGRGDQRAERPHFEGQRHEGRRDDRQRDDRPHFQGQRDERPRDEAASHEGQRRDERPADRAPRLDRPRPYESRGEPRRDEGPREPRPESYAPRGDAPRLDRPATARPRFDGPRSGAPRSDRPRSDGRGSSARGKTRYSDLRSSERRYDAPPVEYKPEGGGERYEHQRPDGQRRGRLDQPKSRYPGLRDGNRNAGPARGPTADPRAPRAGQGDWNPRGPERRGDDERNDRR